MEKLKPLVLLLLIYLLLPSFIEARDKNHFSRKRIPEWRKVNVNYSKKLISAPPKTRQAHAQNKAQTMPAKPVPAQKMAEELRPDTSMMLLAEPKTKSRFSLASSKARKANQKIRTSLSDTSKTVTRTEDRLRKAKEAFYKKDKDANSRYSFGKIGFWMILGSVIVPIIVTFISAGIAVISLILFSGVAMGSIVISEALMVILLIFLFIYLIITSLLNLSAQAAFIVGTIFCARALYSKKADKNDYEGRRLATIGLIISGLAIFGFLLLMSLYIVIILM